MPFFRSPKSRFRSLRSRSLLSVLLAGCLLLLPHSTAQAAPFPQEFNLNTFGWLTPVKNQGQLGSCWAFGNTTAFESDALRRGFFADPTDPDLDLSVWHLATANGNVVVLQPNEEGQYDGWGGFNEYAVGYWTRGRGQWEMSPAAGPLPAGGGPVLNSNNPNNIYPLEAIAQRQDLAPFVSPASQKQAGLMLDQSVLYEWIPDQEDLTSFQDRLKAAIMKYGALSVAVLVPDESDPDHPVWFGTGDKGANHIVALAGWDDSIELQFFDETFTGGWYLQNSWGADMGYTDPVTGEAGYWWVPFADESRGNVKEASAYLVRTRTHDATGLEFAPTVIQNQIFAPTDFSGVRIDRRRFPEGTLTLAAQKQVVPSNSLLGAIGIYQVAGDTTVDLSIYSDWGAFGPTGELLLHETGFTLNPDGPGFNMIDFDTPLRITEGGDFYFLVDYGDEVELPVAVDLRTVMELTPALGTYHGLSWISSDGLHWEDLFVLGEFAIDASIMFMKVFRLLENLDNSAGIDSAFDFTVDGMLSTSPDGAPNSILGLNFYDGGHLELKGPLTVTGGRFHVAQDYETGRVHGAEELRVTGDFLKTGAGELVIASPTSLLGSGAVRDGSLIVENRFATAEHFSVLGPGSLLDVASTGNFQAGSMLVDEGRFSISGVATVSGLTEVLGGGVLFIESSGNLHTDSLAVRSSTLRLLGGLFIQNAFELDNGTFFQAPGSTLDVGSMLLSNYVAEFEGMLSLRDTLLAGSGSRVSFLPGAEAVVGRLVVEGGFVELQPGSLVRAALETLNSGDFVLNGVLETPMFENLPGGLLGGTGLLQGGLSNAGVVSPGNSIGTLTIDGPFAQSAEGSLLIEVANPEQFDILRVLGPASLDGSLAILPLSSQAFAFGDRIEGFLEAESISGSFSSVEMPEGFRGRILNQPRRLSVLFAPESYTQVAATPNQRSVAQALDGFIPATSGDRMAVSTELDGLSAAEYPAAFEAISPGFYQSFTSISIEQIFSLGQVVQQRFRSLQLGATGFESRGLNTNPLPAQTDASKGLPRDPDPFAPGRPWSLWAQGSGIFSNTAGIQALPGFRVASGGFLAGADYRWSPAFVTGLFAGYQGIDARFENGGSATVNGVRFGGYATYGESTGFFAGTMVGGGYSSFRSRRPVAFGDLDRTALATTGAGDVEVLLNSGYNWQVGNFNFGVGGSGQFTHVSVEPFTESGADSLNLSVGRNSTNSLRTLLGGQAAYFLEVAPEFLLIPQISAYWQHEFLQDPTAINATLDAGRGGSFQYTTTAPARDSVLATAGLNFQVGETWNANVFYQSNFARQDFVSHMISAGFGFNF